MFLLFFIYSYLLILFIHLSLSFLNTFFFIYSFISLFLFFIIFYYRHWNLSQSACKRCYFSYSPIVFPIRIFSFLIFDLQSKRALHTAMHSFAWPHCTTQEIITRTHTHTHRYMCVCIYTYKERKLQDWDHFMAKKMVLKFDLNVAMILTNSNTRTYLGNLCTILFLHYILRHRNILSDNLSSTTPLTV